MTQLFPARAGVIPASRPHEGRGELFPARAGVILLAILFPPTDFSVPRTRGGDPLLRGLDCPGFSLFPARAGVIPVDIEKRPRV